MTVKKQPDGRWLADVRPNGYTGKRPRRKFDTKAEALRFEAWANAQGIKHEWNPAAADRRRLSTLCQLWHDLHGTSLKDGEGRLRILLAMCERLGDPVASAFTAKDFTNDRAARIKDVTASTANHEQAYLRAVFNELRRLGEYTGPNPLTDIRPIKTDQPEMSYLDEKQLRTLATAISTGRNRHTFLTSRVCLATGARWSEAESLTTRQVRGHKITFHGTGTKSGKSRTVPIDKALADALAAHRKEYDLPDGRYFASCYASFGKAVQRSKLKLPAGQLSHVLRHTFASHFMMRGGNLLTLQKLLGHADIKMTMKYAHLAPSYLQDAVKLNPSGHFLDNGKGKAVKTLPAESSTD